MLQKFKRFFGGAEPPAAPGRGTASAAPAAPAAPAKLSRGTPASQPIAKEAAAPATPFSLFTSPESLRPRQVDPGQVEELATRMLRDLRESDVVLPPSPVMALRVSVFLKKGDPDVTELVRLIGQDPSMSAKVLQVANSALYAPAREIDTVRAAVTQMGTRSVSTLVLGEASRAMFDPGARAMPEAYRQLSGRLFHDSATASHVAGALCMSINKGRIDRVFLGGMLHDIGKPLVLRLLAARDGALEGDLLHAVLETVHVEAGCHLLSRWELPEGLIGMCQRHHDELIEPGPDGEDLHVLRVASGTVAHLRGAAPGELHAQVLHSMNALKVTPDHTRVLVTDAREASRVVSASYGLDAHGFATPGAPMARASQTHKPSATR